VEGAREIATGAGLPLDAVRIGHIDGDLFDPRCTWLRHREIGPGGAILVRPDRFVAWRSLSGADDPAAELQAALSAVLARPLPTAVPA
jgi:2,4-dichlorophenol 6-monooxygenase